jgi:hypothetical protein
MAMLLLAARVPHRPVASRPFRRSSVTPVTPTRRPPLPRGVAPRATVEATAEAPVQATAETSDGPVSTAVGDGAAVDVIEFEPIDIVGYSDGEHEYEYGYGYDRYDGNLDHHRWRYESRSTNRRWSRTWLHRRGQVLRPTASAFFGQAMVPTGTSGDPCEVFPGACTAAPGGGAFDPPSSGTVVQPVTPSVPLESAAPAEVSRDGDLWRLANARLSLSIDARCQVTTRRADAPGAPAVVTFAPPVEVECVRHETAVPWGDRAGAAIELSWSTSGGSMRAVVALADEGDAAEASVARTDPSGETWLTNLGSTSLTWMIAGSPVTVAPGAAVRVIARRSARA